MLPFPPATVSYTARLVERFFLFEFYAAAQGPEMVFCSYQWFKLCSALAECLICLSELEPVSRQTVKPRVELADI